MKKSKPSGGGILNIAHRGASADYPENTMAAFQGAVEMGADMIEVDVRMSKDGVPVIFHNAKLDAPNQAVGHVSQQPLNTLKNLDVGSWYNPIYASERIPTLEEVLAFSAGKVALNIEIKTDPKQPSGRVVRACLKLVKKYKMENNVLFSSFDSHAVQLIKSIEPKIAAALLLSGSVINWKLPSKLVEQYNADGLHCTYKQLTKRRLADLQEHQIPVTVYTVNDPEKMISLIEMGVNGIITDKPDLLGKVITEYNTT